MWRERKKIVKKEEVDEVSATTVHAQNERLPELCWDYETRNILNLDELGLFFKVLTEKCLMEKRKKTKDTVLINDSDDKNSIGDDKQHVKMVMSFEDLNALVSGCYEMFS